MKINWKVRFKNKVFLASFFSLLIGFTFSMLQLFEVYPPITENQVLNIVNQALTFLGLIGVVTDPTTAGLGDSERALSYDKPWNDKASNDEESPNG